MNSDLLMAMFTRAVTWGITLGVPFLVRWGLVQSSDTEKFVGVASGIVLGLATLLLSWWRAHKTAEHIQTAKALPANATQAETPKVPL